MSTLVTLEKFKEYIKEPTAQTRHDETLQAALDAATVQVQDYCDRLFIQDDETASPTANARTYQATDPYRLHVRDFYSATGLVVKTDDNKDGTYETTWTVTTDFVYGPSDQRTGYPWYVIDAVGSRTFPTASRRPLVQVTALYGWSSVPFAVQQVCLQLAAENWKRGDSPFGQTGFDNFSTMPAPGGNPNLVLSRLKKYRRFPVLVA